MASIGLAIQWLRTGRASKVFHVWLCGLVMSMSVASSFAGSTTTALAVSVTTVAVGTPMTLTATVTGTNPTGTVTFKKGTTVLGTANLPATTANSKTATFSATFTTVATNSITAVYGGNANNTTSTSAAKSVASIKVAPTQVVTSGQNPAASGASVVFTATVNGYIPTGTVTFKDGTTTLGTGTLSGTGNSRTATYTASALSVATHSITAVYAGDALNNTKTSAALSQVVNKVTPTNGLASSGNPSNAGSSVTFTATVTGNAPTGTVQFKNGASSLGAAVALSGSGNTKTAAYTTSALSAASHSITAVYAGDAKNNTVTSSALTQVVNAKTNPTSSLTSSLNPSVSGDMVTFTAVVTGNAPTGSVTFKDGSTTMGSGPLTGTGNTKTATYSKSNLSVASHNITAVYAGDALNAAVTSTVLSQVVGPVKRVPVVGSFNFPGGTPEAGTAFSAPLYIYSDGNTPFVAPTGTVTVSSGGVTYGPIALTADGSDAAFATFNLPATLPIGESLFTVTYSGDARFLPATQDNVSLYITPPTPIFTVSTNEGPDTMSWYPRFKVTMTGTGPSASTVPSGVVRLGSFSGTLVNGSYTFPPIAFPNTLGATHTIYINYSGDASNYGANSPGKVFTIVLPAVSLGLTSNANPALVGSTITFNAPISSSLSGQPITGPVKFLDGANVLATVTPTTDPLTGVMSATFSTNALVSGTHNITAVYEGDPNNGAKTSDVISQLVSTSVIVAPGTPMTWQMGYDALGRPNATVDPLGKTSYVYYDTLGRPIQTQRPDGGAQSIQSFEYNGADSLTKLTDPRSLATTYVPNGLQDIVTQTSPDTATTSFTYSASGKVLTKKDARGKVTTYSYDVLGRPTVADYATGVDSVIEFDGASAESVGKVSKVTDESGQTSFAYDTSGRLITKTQIANGKTFVVTYTWGDAGSSLDKLIAITYPSGNQVNYIYDAYGEISSVTVNTVNANGVGVSGTSTRLLSNITLNASNAITGWTWASNKTQTRTYDQYGQPKTYKLGDSTGTGISAGSVRTIGYDGAGRILGYSHVNNGTAQTSLNQTFGYDDLSRLVSANLNSSAIQYNYDLNGNRTSKVISGTAYNNTVSPTSNKLTQTQDVGGTTAIQYDTAGNVTNDGVNTYTYSDRGRLSSVTTAGGIVNYRYNGFEQRTFKTGPTAIIPTGVAYYVYDESGKLLGEYDANQNPIYETVYLNESPVSVLKQTGTAQGANIATTTYNVYSDHLATPRVITRSTDEAIVWRWDAAEAFGATMPDQNPSNLGTFTFNQRLPGQVFDQETGLFQNWHREYNARLGRYIQSDPIGLKGGINTFAYVEGNPLASIDPMGLMGGGGNHAKKPCKCPIPPPMPQPPNMCPAQPEVNKNITDAKSRYNPKWFYDQVRNKGPWDYKQQGPQYQDFGNFNYGAAGSAFGFPDSILYRMAGWAQQMAGSSKPGWGSPLGGFPYGDDPADQSQIQDGINYARCGCK